MRILITGIAGFIGSHLAELLVKHGHMVAGIDNLSTGKMDNITSLPTGFYPRMIHDCDCRHRSKLRYVISEIKPDFIYHLASTVGVNRVIKDPTECINNNIDSLRNVLELGIPGLFTSTSEVYGKNIAPLSEKEDLVYSSKSRWSYATSKLIGEWLCLDKGWDVVRLFNVVGPRQSMDYGAVLPRFIDQALKGEPITVYGNGKQVRSFTDVGDCVAILDKLRECSGYEVLNVGNPGHTNVVSILELAKIVGDTLVPPEKTFSWRFVDYSGVYPDGFEECLVRVPDLTKQSSYVSLKFQTLSETIKRIAKCKQAQEVVNV